MNAIDIDALYHAIRFPAIAIIFAYIVLSDQKRRQSKILVSAMVAFVVAMILGSLRYDMATLILTFVSMFLIVLASFVGWRSGKTIW